MIESVFEEVSAKTHDRNGLTKSICNRDSVLQKNGVSVDEGILGMVWSCFRVVREYEVCG